MPEVIAPGALKPGTVPLTYNGETVGSATVNADGVVTQIEWDGKIPVDVEQVDVTPDEVYLFPRKPKYNISINGGSNMQFGNGNTQVNNF
jgi:hypothetical protein